MPSRSRIAGRHLVATVLVDGMTAFEPAVAGEVFGYDRSDELGIAWYRHVFCTEVPGRLGVRGGPDVIVDDDFAVLRRADTIVIPGWSHSDDVPTPALVEELRAAVDRGARVVSFCSGAFALAAAGLLDGRRATTHWSHAAKFGARYPAVEFDPKVLYVVDGSLLTSAGSAACIDLSLHIVRRDHGASVANAVARDLVVPPHRDGGQAQFIDAPVPECEGADPLNETLAWALGNLDGDLSLRALSRHAAMSTRNFTRRFAALTGTTPHRWVVHQRVAAAQRLLESTTLPVEIVAERCGFGTAASMRGHFRATVHASPSAYRETFAGATPEHAA